MSNELLNDREKLRRSKGTKLYSIEVSYYAASDYKFPNAKTEIKRWYIHNRMADEVMKFREEIFKVGFFEERSPGSGRVVFPSDLLEIYIDLQKLQPGKKTCFIE